MARAEVAARSTERPDKVRAMRVRVVARIEQRTGSNTLGGLDVMIEEILAEVLQHEDARG